MFSTLERSQSSTVDKENTEKFKHFDSSGMVNCNLTFFFSIFTNKHLCIILTINKDMNESKLHELIYTDLMYTTLLFVHCLMVMVMFQWSGFCVRSTFLIKKKIGGASKNLLALTGDWCRRLCKFLSVCVCVCVVGNVQIAGGCWKLHFYWTIG